MLGSERQITLRWTNGPSSVKMGPRRLGQSGVDSSISFSLELHGSENL